MFFSWLSVLPRTLFAEGAAIKFEVNHIANVFEKAGEKINLFFKFSKEAKASYEQYLLEKRLAELKYVIDVKDGTLIEETSSRYTTYAGKLNQYIVENGIGNKEDLFDMYKRHEGVLSELQKNFEFESGFWLLLQHGINTAKTSQQELSK